MNLKTFYLISVVVFYLSIPLFFYVDRIGFLIHGYDNWLVFGDHSFSHDPNLSLKYYEAWDTSRNAIIFSARAISFIWFVTLLFSVFMLKKGISIAFNLELITVIASGMLVTFFVLPSLIFKGWPPRPL